MKEKILKLISEEEARIREYDRAIDSARSDDRFNNLMALKSNCESFVAKLRAIVQ